MSGAMSRRKGANAERAVMHYLRANGYPDARRYLAGDGRQPGDIDAIADVCIEVKDHGRYDIGAWLRQTITEANGRIPSLWVKPHGVPLDRVDDWWVVLPPAAFLALLADPENDE